MNKIDSYIIRLVGILVSVMTYTVFSVLMDMRTDIQYLKDTKAEEVNVISYSRYINTEYERSIIISNLMYELGEMAEVKEEELNPFRISSVIQLNRAVKLGTTRGE